MKLNVAYPATGCQKLIEIEDERKVRIFYEKRMAQEVDASTLGDEWKGYIVRITGGNDKQGFPMKQGVLTNQRVRLLMSKGHSCYRPRRDGERKRKSVRGCIVDQNLSVISLVIVKKGEQEIAGLTDSTVPRRLGPKRASKIRKLFNLSKEDDVRKYVIRRPVGTPKDGKKQRERAPKIQRLITPQVLQRKRHRLALKSQRSVKRREQAAEYRQLVALRNKERNRRRSRSTSTRGSVSHSISIDAAAKDAKKAAAAAAKSALSKASMAKAAGKVKHAPSKSVGAKPSGAKPSGAKPSAAKPPGAKPAAAKAQKKPEPKKTTAPGKQEKKAPASAPKAAAAKAKPAQKPKAAKK